MDTIISGLVLIGTGATIIILVISNFCCSYTQKINDESNESSHKVRFTNCKKCHVEEEVEATFTQSCAILIKISDFVAYSIVLRLNGLRLLKKSAPVPAPLPPITKC